MKERILEIFKSATLNEVQEGRRWYANAHQYMVELADRYQTSIEIVAGITASLSPHCVWWKNLMETEYILEGKRKHYTTWKQNVRKAKRIARGKEKFSTRKGMKTEQFYKLLCNPTHDAVVIDTHMCDMLGIPAKKVFDSRRLYRKIATAIREVAEELLLSPAQVQAILWIAWKRIKHETNRKNLSLEG